MDINIECPIPGNCKMKYISLDYFKLDQHHPQICFQWNHNANFNNSNNLIDLKVKRDFANIFYLYVHDFDENPMHILQPIAISPKMNAAVFFEKKIIKKLNRDPPNSCVSNLYNNSKNIFPGKYTREACMNTYKCLKVLEKCGDVLDMCRDYIPKDKLEKYWAKYEVNEEEYTLSIAQGCMYGGYESGEFQASDTDCPMACERTKYTVSTSVVQRNDKDLGFVLSLSYKEKNVYQVLEEKEVYTWEDFVSGIGGMIGLFCGFSVLSIAELLVFLGLKAVALIKYCRKKSSDGSNSLQNEDSPSAKNNEAMVIDMDEVKKRKDKFHMNAICS